MGRRIGHRARTLAGLLAGAGVLGGCGGVQSALDPAGMEAERLAALFWAMLAAGAVIWVLVLGLAAYAARRRETPWSQRGASRLILWAGAVLPTALLAVLLFHGLRLMPELRAPGGPLRVHVEGEQFWWRVRYHAPGGAAPVESANEIVLPRGQRVELSLAAKDVIHSFWVPPLAGKVDMIPGRTNRLVLEPTRLGTFRGACAEFCGASHALMAFTVRVVEPGEFTAWLAREAAPAIRDTAAGETARQGEAAFLAQGCGACHSVRGTAARGTIGPDLTHLASRPTLGAGILDNTAANRAAFIARVDEIKPAARMPAYGMLPAAETGAIAAWLGTLR